jgi:hypothetical protein
MRAFEQGTVADDLNHSEARIDPQWLKPQYKGEPCGTSKDVPFQITYKAVPFKSGGGSVRSGDCDD